MLLPPTRFDLPLLLAFLSLSLSAHPTPCILPISLQPFLYVASLSLSLSLSLSVLIYEVSTLFSPLLSATIALLLSFRNALGLCVGVERE